MKFFPSQRKKKENYFFQNRKKSRQKNLFVYLAIYLVTKNERVEAIAMKKDIYEVGILFRGFSVCFVEFQKVESALQKELRDGVFQGLITFANALTGINYSFFSMKKLTIFFTKKKLVGKDFCGNEDIICYVITESKEKKNRFENEDEKRMEKNLKIMEVILDDFIAKYKDTEMCEVSMYDEFKATIKKYAEKLA